MIAHGFAYHWPLAWKIIGGIFYFAASGWLGIIFANWLMRDYRRRVVMAAFFSVLYLRGVIYQHQWWFATYAIWGISFTIYWTYKWFEDGPKVKDPLQIHPLRWIREHWRNVS